MDSSAKIQKKFHSEDDLIFFAKDIGKKLKGGETIELVGDIGAGKTTFVRGLAAGAGYEGHVTSPSFAIQQIYEGKKTICHYDFYRLPEGGILSHELHENLIEEESVTVVEWAETVKDVLPEDRLTIKFQVGSDDSRQLDVASSEKFKYLIDDYINDKN